MNTIRQILGNAWLRAASVRALRTAAQVTALLLVGDAVGPEAGFDVISADWATVGSYAAGGALLSLLTSIKGLPELAENKEN